MKGYGLVTAVNGDDLENRFFSTTEVNRDSAKGGRICRDGWQGGARNLLGHVELYAVAGTVKSQNREGT
jgi:hypothetical protein